MINSNEVRKTPAPHLEVRPEWLALHREDALEPALPIVDAHHHLWSFPEKTYRASDFLEDIAGGHHIVSTVFVECKTNYLQAGPENERSLGEIFFVNGERKEVNNLGVPVDVASAYVGYADLSLGNSVVPVLDTLVKQSKGLMRSVRNIAVWHADPNVRASVAMPPERLMSSNSFREGFASLAANGLAFDAWLIHTQLAELRDLAQAFPDTQIILNHIGGPLALGPYATQRLSVFEKWSEQMDLLSRQPNVTVKVGGFGMPLFGFDFASRATPPDSQQIAEVIRPYVDTCINLFGADRCMFESNFPVDKGSYSYTTIWNAFKRLVSRRTERDIDMLFRGTAVRLYRLPTIVS